LYFTCDEKKKFHHIGAQITSTYCCTGRGYYRKFDCTTASLII